MKPDVLVLGGGVIGCAAALALRDRGLAVSVVDRGAPVSEASAAAAGILGAQLEAHGPGPLADVLAEGRGLWRAFAEALGARSGVELGYREDGALVVCAGEAELEAAAGASAWQRAAGLPVERLDAAALRACEPALGEAAGAIRFGGDGQVDPRRLGRALEIACARAGVTFVSAQARRVLLDGGRALGAELDGARVSAGHVVVACGAWSALLEGAGLRPDAVRPVRGQILVLEALPPPLRHVVFGDGGYLVPRADGRILVGSTEERVGFVKAVTAGGLARLAARAVRLVPALEGARAVDAWCGLRPESADGLPLVGATPIAGLHVASGHYRNGILLAPLTAAWIAAGVLGERLPAHAAALAPGRLFR